jgi:hypothetical protein
LKESDDRGHQRLVLAHQEVAPAPIADERPVWFYAGSRRLHLPRYLASVQAEGGLVTTASELATIGRAVFEGRLFDIDALPAQQDWRMIFWPGQFYFGLGMEKLWTPWFISPLRPIRDVMGFWGRPVPSCFTTRRRGDLRGHGQSDQRAGPCSGHAGNADRDQGGTRLSLRPACLPHTRVRHRCPAAPACLYLALSLE